MIEDEVQGKVIITAAAVRTAGPGAVTSTGGFAGASSVPSG